MKPQDVSIALCPPNRVGEAWFHVEPVLAPALELTGDFDAAYALSALRTGEWQLWLATAPGVLLGAGVSWIATYPCGPVCEVLFAGGRDAAAWAAKGWDAIEGWARANQCRAMRCFARKGWMRSGVMPAQVSRVADILEVRL